MSCPACQRHRLVEVQLKVSDRHLTMHSCSHCQTKWWDDEEGKPVDLRHVLELAGTRR